VESKLTAKQELNFKIYKSRVSFLLLDQPNEPKSLDVALNIAGVEKYARKTCDCGQPGGHSIRKGALVTVEICVPSQVFPVVSDSQISLK